MFDELLAGRKVAALLDRLGVAKAHVAASSSLDWSSLSRAAPERLASLALVTPYLAAGSPPKNGLPACPTLVVAGSRGKTAQQARALAEALPDASLVALPDYESRVWDDVARTHADPVGEALQRFFDARADAATTPAEPAEKEGAHDGVSFRILGSGPALLLTPLLLAPSQWEPLLPRLAQRFTLIVLGGRHLGAIATLEERAEAGYGEFAAAIALRTAPAPGERILEVGCGSGAVARSIARATTAATGVANPITAIDVNPYLVSEAQGLAAPRDEGERIAFEVASGEDLPFEDGAFDITVCFTVLEEVDADLTISEIARVTRPGGRIALATRAVDILWWSNLPVSDALAGKMNALGLKASAGGVGPKGCGDRSLYDRVSAAGLKPLLFGPQYCTYRSGQRLSAVIGRMTGGLDGRERDEALAALAEMQARNTLLAAEPFHVAVALKEA